MTIDQDIKASEKAMSFEPGEINYSINLGFPTPNPAGSFEFAIIGEQDKKREAISKILELLESNGAMVISVSFWNGQSADKFIMDIACDLNQAKCAPDELLIRVNKLKYVKVAEMSQLEGRVFGKFMFPLTFFGDIRALAIDADRFVRLLDEFTKKFGTKAKEAMFENGRLEGKEVITVLKEKLGEKAKDKQLLFENAIAFLQTAGWGKLLFFPEGAELYKISINNPPSDSTENIIMGNYFLQGLVAGILESFLRNGIRLSMIREGYEEERKNLIMYYMDRAAIKELASSSGEEDEIVETRGKQMKIGARVLAMKNRTGVSNRFAMEREGNKNIDETVVQVQKIIKSIDEIKQEKIASEKVVAQESSSDVVSEQGTRDSPSLVQGEIIGSGIQIIQQVEKVPSPSKLRKKTIAQDDGLSSRMDEESSF
jgi:hypothetical protein